MGNGNLELTGESSSTVLISSDSNGGGPLLPDSRKRAASEISKDSTRASDRSSPPRKYPEVARSPSPSLPLSRFFLFAVGLRSPHSFFFLFFALPLVSTATPEAPQPDDGFLFFSSLPLFPPFLFL